MNDARDPKTYAIIGAAMEVHRVLGPGFLERVYQDALAVEMKSRDVPFAREVNLPVMYKNSALPAKYRADFICFGKIIVECKALDGLTGVEESQVINYLKVTRHAVALLLNIGGPSLDFNRFVN